MRPPRKSRWFGIVPMVVAAALFVSVPAHAAVESDAVERQGGGMPARYGDRVIDLAQGWDGAGACVVWPKMLDIPECFDTEAEMDRRVVDLETRAAFVSPSTNTDAITATSSSSCTSSLRLYDGTYYTGAVLYLRGRWQWFNLADYGFDQRTSSYVIGACSAWFADWTNGGGDWYPTSLTEAYDVAPTMLSGWDNDVSSVYIT